MVPGELGENPGGWRYWCDVFQIFGLQLKMPERSPVGVEAFGVRASPLEMAIYDASEESDDQETTIS